LGGIIALAGLDAETGVVMLLYLDLATTNGKKKGLMRHAADLRDPLSRRRQARPPKAMNRVRHHRRSGADFCGATAPART